LTFRELPVAARIHVAAVMCGGIAACIWSVRLGAFERPWLLLLLVLTSIAAHTLKIDLPLSTSSSTLSTGYAVGFASLLLFGIGPVLWMMVSGAWAQCTLNTKGRNRWYQTAFSISTLTLSMLAAGVTLAATGGTVLTAPADVVVPSIVASALVYFLVNSTLMALAIGLSSNRSPLEIWDREFIWGAPNYFMGALAATVAVQGLHRFGLAAIILLIAPLFLTYRLYKAYVSRVDEMSRANRELHVEVQRAQAESLTDPLTELPNRRGLAEHVSLEIARAERQGQPFALIVLDLDGFKAINDTFGHQRGDAALALVATTLRAALRSYDVCCRYAGDEFAVVLSNCPADQAHVRAQAMLTTIAELTLEAAPGSTLALRASAGVAAFPDDGRTYHALFDVADARMYANKTKRDTSAASGL
jgi:diguanylate cyclase (GGDEF)-like protein